MAVTFPTLAQVLTIGDSNLAPYEASNLVQGAPLLGALFAQPASDGTTHKWLRETAAPTVGFRVANAGLDTAPGTYALQTQNLKILSANSYVDKAVADSAKKGPASIIGKYAMSYLRQALTVAERQLIYGTGNDSDGFTGLAEATGYTLTSGSMVYNAGGDTVNSCSSVWIFDTNESAVSLILGNDGRINIGDTIVQSMDDGSGAQMPVYYTPQEGWLGLQIGSTKDMARICNLDFDHTLTDDMLYEALALFGAYRQGPKLIVMNMNSAKELRGSRTATTPTGAAAPWVRSFEDHTIVITDAITNTEAVVAAS